MLQHNDIPLTGLIGSNPLGALAAFGLLRVCSEISDLMVSRLYWSRDLDGIPMDDWVAVLRVPNEIGRIELIENLVTHQKNRSFGVFEWSRDIRISPQEYHEILSENAEISTLHDRLDADYFAAFGSEIVTDGSKGLVKPTAFHMTSGQQKFLENICKISTALRSGDACIKAFEEALFGPWRYEDRYHSLGWDPSTERLYAYRYKDPSKKTRDDSPRSVIGAVWFAVESLPLFPTAASRGRLETTGFTTKKDGTKLIWPIWTRPISIDALRTLLMTSELTSGNKYLEALGRRGVSVVYQADRSEFGQGYAILRPANQIWCI
jgi:hypothetical protein